MTNLKRGIFLFIAFTLVIGIVGVFPAKAVTIADGDLVKVADSSALYLIQGSKKRVFPHLNVYLSWGYPADFNTVKTVSASELAAYADDNAVPFRDGSLFRGTATSLHGKEAACVFYVDAAVLRPVISEEIYMALFNDADWSLVTWVPDDLLSKFEYPEGSIIESSAVLPDDLLVKHGDSYGVVADGAARYFSNDAAITANRYSKADAVVLSEAPSEGTAITGAESELLTVGWQGEAAPVTADLEVGLAADTPGAATLPLKATNVPLLKFNLKNTGSVDITVDSMIFKRTGVGAAGDYDGLYIYEGAIKLTNARTVSSDTNLVEFATFIQTLSVPAGSTKAVTLKGDVDTAAGSASNQDAFRLQTVTSDAASVSGLPITGSLMTIGSQEVSEVTVYAGVAPSNPTVGAKNATLAEFAIEAGNNPIDFEQVIINMTGSLDSSDMSNLEIVYLGEVLAAADTIVKDEITFTMTSPYRIPKSVKRTFNIKGDVGGRVGRTIQLYLDETSDLVVTDAEYDYGAYIGTNGFSGDSLTLEGGEINLADDGPVAGNIPADSSDVSILDFSITPNRNVEVKRIQVRIQIKGTAGTEALDVANQLHDLRIKDADTGTTIAGPFDYQPSTIAAVSTTWGNGVNATYNSTAVANQLTNDKTWTDTFTIDAGVVKNLQVTTDIHKDTDANILIKAEVLIPSFDSGGVTYAYIKDTDTNDWIEHNDVIPTSLSGEQMTITATSLAITRASLPELDTIVKGATDVDSLGIVLTASNAGDITVRKIMADVIADDTDATFASLVDARTVVASAKLYDGDTLLDEAGINYVSASYSTATFDNLEIVVPAGTNKKLTIKADIKAVSAERWYYFDVVPDSDVTAYDANGSITISGATGINATPSVYFDVKIQGNLSMTAETEPRTDIVVAGATGVTFSKIKFKAQYEAWTVSKLRINNAGYTAYGDDEVIDIALSYPKEDGTTGTTSGTLNGGYAEFSNLAIYVPKDGSAILTIKTDINTITAGADSGHQPQFGVDCNSDDGNTSTEAIGQASGAKLTSIGTSDADGQAMVVRKTKPVVELVSLPSVALADGTLTIAKFKVSANANEAVALKKVTFDITVSDQSTSTPIYVDYFKLYDASNMSTALTTQMKDDAGTDITGAATTVADGSNTAYIAFGAASELEEVVSAGGSKTFVLKARIRNTAQYDSLMTKLIIDNDDSIIYDGYPSGVVGGVHTLVDITGVTAGSTVTDQAADFIWSDNSDGYNHDYALDVTTLTDWTDGYLIKYLPTDYQTMTR